MARRMSNKARIQKKAEEAAAAKKAKKKAKKTVKKTVKKAAKKKKAKKASSKRAAASTATTRMKIVWAVCSSTGKIVKTYPYPEKAAAKAEAARLTKSKNSEHSMRAEKVPMEDD